MKIKHLELASATIERRILLVRGLKVMLDSDLAGLYEVSTKRLNEQVRRNLKRFPADFMIQLIPNEYASLRSRFATLLAASADANTQRSSLLRKMTDGMVEGLAWTW